MNIIIKAPAKVNLYLEVFKKNNKRIALHNIETIMQSVSLSDVLYISCLKNNLKTNKISIVSNNKDLNKISNFKNSVYIACSLFFKEADIVGYSVNIKIDKNIPLNAGLAGGSSDAAAALIAFNNMFLKKFDGPSLCKLGSKIGSDVPFCILGGTSFVSHAGNTIIKLKDSLDYYMVICKPDFDVCTKDAYDLFDKKYNSQEYKKNNINNILRAINEENLNNISLNLYNRFEEVIYNDEIFNIKKIMKENGALSSIMTGSGSAVFGIFANYETAKNCKKALSLKYINTFICEPVSRVKLQNEFYFVNFNA